MSSLLRRLREVGRGDEGPGVVDDDALGGEAGLWARLGRERSRVVEELRETRHRRRSPPPPPRPQPRRIARWPRQAQAGSRAPRRYLSRTSLATSTLRGSPVAIRSAYTSRGGAVSGAAWTSSPGLQNASRISTAPRSSGRNRFARITSSGAPQTYSVTRAGLSCPRLLPPGRVSSCKAPAHELRPQAHRVEQRPLPGEPLRVEQPCLAETLGRQVPVHNS